MPTYNIKNIKTGKVKQMFMGISESDQWLKDNPGHERLCGAPGIHSGGGLGLKSVRNDSDFTSRIKQVKKNFPRNTLNNYT